MEDPVAEAILNQYFRRLEQALSGLAVDRRTQIVEDLRAHVEESLAAETDRSDATVLSILDRLGDPEEIAQEALADEATEVATGVQSNATHGPARRGGRVVPKRLRLAAPLLVALAVAVVVVFSLTGGPSSAAPNARSKTPVNARIHMLSPRLPGAVGDGWLPASDVSGDHQSPGASDCAPQTTSGSESASSLEAGATEVASGSVDGHAWSVWSKNGQSGANGLETGGVVVDGVAYGMCPGFPNPGEMELLEPSGGGDGLAYGVVGYPGTAKVAIYSDTFGNFATTKLVASTTAQKVNGVGFFITSLSESACDVSGVEMNTASSSNATEHNLAFATSDCKNGQLVPISDSQGIWGLPTRGFPNKLQSGGGGGGGDATPTLTKGGWLPAADVSGGGGPDDSSCSPQTLSGSESAATLEADATEVASGTTAGHSWSVWSKNGESGATGLEDGGVVVDGVAYGMCPGFPNPSETELLEPSGGGDGLAYGVVGYAGTAKVAIYQGTVETFDSGQLLATTTAQTVNGVGFYITPLSQSACGVSSLEINVASQSDASEHNLGFTDNDCSNGQLVPISWSQGIWGLPPSGFPNKFQTGNGGGGDALLSPAGSTATSYDSHKVASVLASRYRILKTNRVRASTLPGHLGVTMLSRVGPRLGLDTSDVAEVKPVAGVTMWLIPGTRGVCVFEFQEGGGSGSCSSISTGLESGGMAFNAAGATTEGFAPNGVTTVTVSLANGRKLSVPVKDNAYFVRVRGTRITGVRRS